MEPQGYNKYLLLWGRIAGGAADGNAGTRCRRLCARLADTPTVLHQD